MNQPAHFEHDGEEEEYDIQERIAEMQAILNEQNIVLQQTIKLQNQIRIELQRLIEYEEKRQKGNNT